MPKLTHALFKVMRRLDGAKFNGHLTTASAVTTKEKAPYRVLYARKPTFLNVGDTVFSDGGEVVILMEHPDDFDWATSFKAVYAVKLMAWYRPVKVLHPVAHVEQDAGYSNMGQLYVNFDMAEEMKFEGFMDTKYRFITGQDIRVDDKIGVYIVKRIVESLGVKVVYAS